MSSTNLVKAPTIGVTVDLRIYDEKAFRRAAYERGIEDGLSEEEAKEYLDPDSKSLGECGQMLIDPGVSPEGTEILQSSSESLN